MGATAATVTARPAGRIDGGRAWLDMGLAALSMFTAFLAAYTFGTFIKPMAEEFDSGRGATAFVFGLTTFIYFGLGAITGPLVHKVGPRRLVLFGGAWLVAGVLLTSRVNAIWQAYLTYGIGVGIGVSCLYVPMVAVVGGWFDRRRPVAIGLAVSGIGLSSLFGAPIAARLIKAYGWRDAYLILALVSAVLVVIVAAFVRTPPGFGHAPPSTLSGAVRSRRFVLPYLATLLGSITLFNVFVNIIPYAEDNGISKVTAATLVSIIGGASIAGRNILAWIARRVGTPGVYFTSFAVMTATQMLWLVSGGSYAALALFALVFGFAYGGFISLAPVLMAELFGPEQLGGLIGINYTSAGIGALFGPTLGAWLVDRTDRYTATIWVGFACGAVSAVLLAMLVRTVRSTPM